MNQRLRLDSGGRIDRSQPISFRFNKRIYSGFVGDTAASALLANGVDLVARSFKYHRPRGIIGSGAEESNALLQVGCGSRSVPNLRATQIELHEGLELASVNCWPSVNFDVYAIIGAVSSLAPAGFYYKTFMSPEKLWPFYEQQIRKAAGFGVAADDTDPDRYDKLNAWCDVLVAGGGAAGLAAALAAARSGARVILADEQNELGGGILRTDCPEKHAWLKDTLTELSSYLHVQLLVRCCVSGYYDYNFIVMNERLTDHLANKSSHQARERLWRVRAKQVVLATGAIERPLVFGNNDLPGIMLASAVSTYVNRYAVVPGRKAVLFTNNNYAYSAALDLLEHGIDVTAIVDARPEPSAVEYAAVRRHGVKIHNGCAVVRATGRKRVSNVSIMHLSSDAQTLQGKAISIPCDLLAVSGGWSPAVHLNAQSGCRPQFDEDMACFLPDPKVPAQFSSGAAAGKMSFQAALRDGYEKGLAAAGCDQVTAKDTKLNNMPMGDDAEYSIRPLWQVPNSKSGQSKRFVDFQNDTTAGDIDLAAREGYRSIELVKRYTALGFGTDQGKLGNINGMAILVNALGQSLKQAATTTFRPMYTPVSFGAIAGRDLGEELFDPVRRTAMHSWHVEHGAEFENVGQWKRPYYYPKPGESLQQAVNRECSAVRNSVGMMDASTLGKIEVYGPDATEFLNFMYTNAWNQLKAGYCRYGLMLGEDGMVMDDGVSAKLGDNHYHMTTTTGGAAHVLAWMERWRQTEWPHMKVYFTSVSDQWAVIAIAGPKSKDVLQTLTDDSVDLSGNEFPFMSFREFEVAGVLARVFRISFSGELAYEVNVPANYGLYVWREIYAAGSQYDITPYGTETMHVLRAEKGFIIVGQDTDGSVTPVDLGMNWIISKKKDFIGNRSLSRSDCLRSDRKQLVGLKTEDPNEVLPEGAQLVEAPDQSTPVPMIGHVTSSYWSECLGRSIALAVVKGGQTRMGSQIYAQTITGNCTPVTISSPVFYDPEGNRQNV